MTRAEPFLDEWQQLSTLLQDGVLDNAPEREFDDLTALAARLCDAPVALLSFVGGSRVWLTARGGLEIGQGAGFSSFVTCAIAQRDLLLVPDATQDERFAANPWVNGPPGIRFFAVAPVTASSGEVVGALGVMDVRPRTLTDDQAHDLRLVGREIEAHVELRRRTLALSDQNRLIRAIVDSEPECVKLLGRDGTLRMMNRAGLEIIEADSFEQVAGQPLFSLVAPEDRPAFESLTEHVFRGEAGSLEFQITGLKGTRRWLETRAVPLGDDRGAIVALLGITRDITEHKRADIALRESERKYRLLFEQATDGIFLTDAEGCLLDVNPAARQLTGYSHAELLRLRITDLIDPTEVPRVAPVIERLLAGETVTTEWRGYRKDGTAIVGEVTAKRLPDGRLQTFVRDISERKRSEMALRESESRLQQAVHAGRVGLWDWDLQTNRVFYSSEWKRQIGYEDHEISDGLDEWRDRVHPEDLPSSLAQLDAFLTGASPTLEAEFRFRHKDGSYRHILTQASKVADASGRVVRVVGSQVDITERSELQARLLQAQKMETVGRLAGGVAHDFNNLLTVINGVADLAVANTSDGDPLRSELQEIRQAGERAASLTKQLLALSRQQILRPEVLNLNDIVMQMRGMLERLVGEHIQLELTLSKDVGCIKADPGQVEQLLLNLVVNARDAMADGGTLAILTCNIELDAHFAIDDPTVVPGPHVRLTVSDSGVGMDAATCRRIFEPYFTTKAPGKGTGLGLSTVYGIVKQTGGRISVSSEPGRGTSFEIDFPRVVGVPQLKERTPDHAVTGGTETILLVEDEPAIRHLTRRILTTAGYTVLEAGTGDEALALLRDGDWTPDLLLTDVVMPGISGRELATRIGQLRPGIKVLYMSGYTDDYILHHGVLNDASRFITKPYTPAELKRRLRQAFEA